MLIVRFMDRTFSSAYCKHMEKPIAQLDFGREKLRKLLAVAAVVLFFLVVLFFKGALRLSGIRLGCLFGSLFYCGVFLLGGVIFKKVKGNWPKGEEGLDTWTIRMYGRILPMSYMERFVAYSDLRAAILERRLNPNRVFGCAPNENEFKRLSEFKGFLEE